MDYWKNQLIEIDDCLYNFNVINFYDAAIRLFKVLEFPVNELEEDNRNLSIEELLRIQGETEDFINPSEKLAVSQIEKVSILFVLNSQTKGLEYVEEYNDGIFIGASIIVIGVEIFQSEYGEFNDDNYDNQYIIPAITTFFNRLINTQILIIVKKGSKIALSVKRRRINKKDYTLDAKGSNFQTNWLKTFPPSEEAKSKILEFSFDNFRDKNFYFMYSDIVKCIAEEFFIEDFPVNNNISSHINITDGLGLYFRDMGNLHSSDTNIEINTNEVYEDKINNQEFFILNTSGNNNEGKETAEEVAASSVEIQSEFSCQSENLLDKENCLEEWEGKLVMGEKIADLENLIVLVREKFPNKAIDISESLVLLKETINETINSINDEVSIAFVKRDFVSARDYTQVAESINKYEQKIDYFIELLEVDDIEENINVDEMDEPEKDIITDYTAYNVDTNVEHTLYENFTHKRPFAFRINDSNIIEVKTWQEMLLKTCELLIAVDEEKFLQFEDNPTMNGKKRKYFSRKDTTMTKPKLVSDKIFVETNISGNGVRNLLLKLLKEFGYKTSEYKVYLRADYTELHS